MGVWEYGSMGVWEYGSMGVWEFGSMGVWVEGLPRGMRGWRQALSIKQDERLTVIILIVLLKPNFISWCRSTVLFYQFFEHHENIFNVFVIALYFHFKLSKLQ